MHSDVKLAKNHCFCPVNFLLLEKCQSFPCLQGSKKYFVKVVCQSEGHLHLMLTGLVPYCHL